MVMAAAEDLVRSCEARMLNGRRIAGKIVMVLGFDAVFQLL